MSLRLLDGPQTASLLPYPALAQAVSRVLELARRGQAQAPERLRTPLPAGSGAGGVLLTMPAVGGGLAAVKVISVHPGNRDLGLPLIRGEVLVLDAATGERLGLLDGPAVTARRTAAVSLLAAMHLAPNPDGPLLVVGAGVQARAHLEAFREGLGVRRAYVAARSRESAHRLADHGRALGMEMEAVSDPNDVLAQCPLVVTATTSPAPVVGEHVRNGAFVAAVGNFSPTGSELPAPLVRRARLYVDDLGGARHEAGEYLLAGVDWETVTPLIDAAGQGGSPGVPAAGPLVFKSVGCALWDLAAALLAFGRIP